MNGALRGGLLTLMLLVSSAALADERPSPERIRVMFEAATDALDAGDLVQAQQLYLEVWKHQQTYDVATNLTGIEYQLGNYPTAAEFARTALGMFPPSEDPRARAQLEQLFEQARREVGTATIEAPAGAEVKLDGRVLGTAPLEEVFVTPGTHRFEATHGRASASEEVTVSRGATFTVTLSLRDATQGPAAAAEQNGAAPAPSSSNAGSEVEADAGSRRSPARPIAIVAGSVLTAASVSAAVVFRVKAARLDADADRALARAEWATGVGGCADADHEACDKLADTLDRRDRAGLLSNVALGASIAFGAATIGAVVWPRRHREAAGLHLHVAPWAAPGSRGVVVEGRFR